MCSSFLSIKQSAQVKLPLAQHLEHAQDKDEGEGAAVDERGQRCVRVRGCRVVFCQAPSKLLVAHAGFSHRSAKQASRLLVQSCRTSTHAWPVLGFA
jgi:hypothetical protein